MSLFGLTHKQAVQCLKGPGQVARLVLERRSPRIALPSPSADDRMGDVHMAVSLVTAGSGRPASCVSVTNGSAPFVAWGSRGSDAAPLPTPFWDTA